MCTRGCTEYWDIMYTWQCWVGFEYRISQDPVDRGITKYLDIKYTVQCTVPGRVGSGSSTGCPAFLRIRLMEDTEGILEGSTTRCAINYAIYWFPSAE